MRRHSQYCSQLANQAIIQALSGWFWRRGDGTCGPLDWRSAGETVPKVLLPLQRQLLLPDGCPHCRILDAASSMRCLGCEIPPIGKALPEAVVIWRAPSGRYLLAPPVDRAEATQFLPGRKSRHGSVSQRPAWTSHRISPDASGRPCVPLRRGKHANSDPGVRDHSETHQDRPGTPPRRDGPH